MIGLATSKDGIHFKRYEGNPVITPTERYELQSVMNPCVIWDENDDPWDGLGQGNKEHEDLFPCELEPCYGIAHHGGEKYCQECSQRTYPNTIDGPGAESKTAELVVEQGVLVGIDGRIIRNKGIIQGKNILGGSERVGEHYYKWSQNDYTYKNHSYICHRL